MWLTRHIRWCQQTTCLCRNRLGQSWLLRVPQIQVCRKGLAVFSTDHNDAPVQSRLTWSGCPPSSDIGYSPARNEHSVNKIVLPSAKIDETQSNETREKEKTNQNCHIHTMHRRVVVVYVLSVGFHGRGNAIFGKGEYFSSIFLSLFFYYWKASPWKRIRLTGRASPPIYYIVKYKGRRFFFYHLLRSFVDSARLADWEKKRRSAVSAASFIPSVRN